MQRIDRKQLENLLSEFKYFVLRSYDEGNGAACINADEFIAMALDVFMDLDNDDMQELLFRTGIASSQSKHKTRLMS